MKRYYVIGLCFIALLGCLLHGLNAQAGLGTPLEMIAKWDLNTNYIFCLAERLALLKYLDRCAPPASGSKLLRLWSILARLVVGHGLWLDRGQQQCLILWHKLDAWAQIIYEWARSSGLQDSVMTIDELSSGDEVQGTGRPLLGQSPVLSAYYLASLTAL